jgi:hypothetical protein
MLAMTTLRHIYHTVAGLAEQGRRLAAADLAAWQALAGQFQELADQEGGYAHAEHAPADFGDQVWALHDQLTSTDTPAASLARRWLTGWLIEYADPEAIGRVRGAPLAVAVARALPGNRQGQVRTAGSLPRPLVRQPTRRHGNDGWAVLRLGNVPLKTAVDHWCLMTISGAAELTCLADGRPWQWLRDDSEYQVHIGPPPGPSDSAAGQLAADLEHLAQGLNPGPWRITTAPVP